MKIFDPKKQLPVGWDWEKLRFSLGWFHGLSTLSILAFLKRYADARQLLYRHEQGLNGLLRPVLDPEQTIAPFFSLLRGMPLAGMWCFFAVMAIYVWRFYTWHTQDSMSIYTMRRLSDPWELHRRCWLLPLLSCAVEIVLYAGLTALCAAVWWFATPSPCRPL